MPKEPKILLTHIRVKEEKDVLFAKIHEYLKDMDHSFHDYKWKVRVNGEGWSSSCAFQISVYDGENDFVIEYHSTEGNGFLYWEHFHAINALFHKIL